MNYCYITPKSQFCNILFQICTCVYYAKKHNLIPVCDIVFINEWLKDKTTQYLSTFIFNNINIVNNKFKNAIPINDSWRCDFYHKLKDIYDNNVYLSGLFQSPKYWDNDKQFAIKLFEPPYELINCIKLLYNNINFDNTVSIHIRRTDFLIDLAFRNIDNNYINNIINIFYNDKQKFLLFSDDIEWCKQNIHNDNIIFADKHTDEYPMFLVDLYAMTLCKDNIIHPGSTFSWWGAYLNIHNSRKVYYSTPWYNNNRCINTQTQYYDIIPENDNWLNITLNN